MLKKIVFLLIFGILTNSFGQTKNELVIKKNTKVGLSLSGGGAKGFAHVGLLKVLDSLGVKVDYVAGTSMGSIVGALYSAGYTGKDIEKIVLTTDFYNLISNEKSRKETSFFNKSVDKYLLTVPIKGGKINILPKAITTGQKNIYMLKELLKNVSSTDDFSKLPIPFLCIATNLETGNIKIFENGDLSQSILASSAFPSLIDPVKIGDSLYIDGAVTINYPSKPLKDRNIDLIIGVDLSQGLAKRDQLNSAIDILNQVVDYNIQKETKNQLQYTDINIKPDLTGKTATSYDAKKEILDSGYRESLKYADILNKLPKRKDSLLRAPFNSVFSSVYKIDEIELLNNKIYNKDYVLGKMNLKLPSIQSYGAINKMVDKLYATNNYELVNYEIVQKEDKNILKISVNENDTRFFLKFGLHYDEIFKSGLLLNFTAKRLFFKNSTISLDVILGDKPRYYFNYFIDNGYIPGFGIYASGMNFNIKNKNFEDQENIKWFRNEVYTQSISKDKYAIGGGVSLDYFEIKNFSSFTTTYDKYINPYFFIKTDTQNDKDFPTSGILINTEGKILNLLSPDTENKIIQAKGDVRLNFPISKNITNRLNLFGGFTLGENLPNEYYYNLGGIFEQNLGNFIHFSGYQLGQEKNQNMILASNELQINFLKNYFLIANFNIANLFEKISVVEMLKINYSSVGITAAYKSPFGQIKLNYSQALDNKKGIFSVVLGHWF